MSYHNGKPTSHYVPPVTSELWHTTGEPSAVSEHLLLQRRPNAAQTYVTEHLVLQPHELYQNEQMCTT